MQQALNSISFNCCRSAPLHNQVLAHAYRSALLFSLAISPHPFGSHSCGSAALLSEFSVDQFLFADDFPGFQAAQGKPVRTALRLYLKPHPEIPGPV